MPSHDDPSAHAAPLLGSSGSLAGVLDLLAEGFLLRRAGGVLRLNPAARALLGGDLATAVLDGSVPAELHDEAGRPVPGSLLSVIAGLDPSPAGAAVRVRIQLPDGQRRWLRLRRSEVPGGEDEVTLLTDVTTEVSAQERLGQRRAAREAHARIAELAASPFTSYQALIEMLVAEVAELCGASGAALLRVSADQAVVAAGTGDWKGHTTARVGLEGAAEPVAVAGQAAAALEVGRAGIAAAGFALAPGVEGVAVVSDPNGLGPGSAEALLGFIGLSGSVIAHRDALMALERVADTDQLTGLARFARFHERLAQEVEDARERRRPVAVVLFDIDNLGALNGSHGADAGDRVIAAVANRLERVIGASRRRSRNLIARMGGGTFAWLLPGSDALLAETTAELGRMQVSSAPFPEVGHVSVCAGVCDAAQGAGGAAEAMRLAAGALYWAKSHGRNQVCRYRSEVVSELSLSDRVARLEREISQNALRALAKAVDLKDTMTREHSLRVARIAEQLAAELGWSPPRVTALREVCWVHDVGKIGVADSVLFKPQRLTPAEYEMVQEHTVLGAQIASEFLTPEQAVWVRGHHERWDGDGYPDGLAGERIPDGARVIFVADALEAMTARRPYSNGISLREAIGEVRAQAGHQFDPDVVEAMMRLDEREELGWIETETSRELAVRAP